MKPTSVFIHFTILLVVSACSNNRVGVPSDLSSAIPSTVAPENTATAVSTVTVVHAASIPRETPVPTNTTSSCPDVSVGWQATPSAEWFPTLTATLPIETGERLSPEEIGIALFCQYLENYKSPQADISQRLNDYSVYHAPRDERLQHLRNEFQVDFIVWVSFSVLPTRTMYSGWAAGNGEISNDGWIRNKSLIVGIFKHEEVYEMKIIGTGP